MKLMRLLLILLLAALPLAAQTTDNDDSCDVAPFPAATLLLPYFEVDLASPAGTAQTTLFTIVNTTRTPQIASVTLWTDWAFPVLNFDVFLTGYDVQAIDLRSIFSSGLIVPTSSLTTPGSRSVPTGNPLFLGEASTLCASLPGPIPAAVLEEVRAAFTIGSSQACGTTRIGGTHTNAIGYATIDVVATCRPTLPTEPRYFDELLYENVLTGDFMIVQPNPAIGNFAAGSPLVHIRAVPEGGPAGQSIVTNLPRTFYQRLVGNARGLDRRQPLPSAWTSRWIQGGPTSFQTHYLMWREAVTGSDTNCSVYGVNSRLELMAAVRFDERENPVTVAPQVIPFPPGPVVTPTAFRMPSASGFLPPNITGDVGGWIALNLDHRARDAGARPAQSWLVPMMFAEGRYSAAFDATALANGCSASFGSNISFPNLGPGANETP